MFSINSRICYNQITFQCAITECNNFWFWKRNVCYLNVCLFGRVVVYFIFIIFSNIKSIHRGSRYYQKRYVLQQQHKEEKKGAHQTKKTTQWLLFSVEGFCAFKSDWRRDVIMFIIMPLIPQYLLSRASTTIAHNQPHTTNTHTQHVLFLLCLTSLSPSARW